MRIATSQVDNILLSFSKMAHKYAARNQRSEQDHMDLYQEGMLALCKALRRYAECGLDCKNLQAFAATVLVRAMHRHNYRTNQYTKRHTEVGSMRKAPEVVDPTPLPLSEEGALFEQVFTAAFFNEFEELYGTEARRVVQSVFNPPKELRLDVARSKYPRTRGESADAYAARVERLAPFVSVSKSDVRRFYNIPSYAFWTKYMRGFEAFTRHWCESHNIKAVA